MSRINKEFMNYLGTIFGNSRSQDFGIGGCSRGTKWCRTPYPYDQHMHKCGGTSSSNSLLPGKNLFSNAYKNISEIRLVNVYEKLTSSSDNKKISLMEPNKVYNSILTAVKNSNISAKHEAKYMDVPLELGSGVLYDFIEGVADELLPSELFVNLGRGTTLQNLRIGTEEKLIETLLSKNDRSVGVDDLFEYSYTLNNGNVFDALLCVENVLTKDRADVDNRNSMPLAMKLKYVAGENNSKEGDNIGCYYHYFATALYAYAKNNTFIAKVATVFDEIPSFFLEKVDYNETYAGYKGAELGLLLRNLPTQTESPYKTDKELLVASLYR